MREKNIAVIGGGAAGLMAAITILRNGGKAVVYESKDRVGKKILATGNGRCNMTNINAGLKNYHGENPRFINGVMHKFWVEETIEFFDGLGVITKTEDEGKVYPYCDQASAVLDALRFEIERLGGVVYTDFDVERISKRNNMFEIVSYSGKKAFSDKVILTTGGKAAPALGASGTGYELARRFGHSVTGLYPSLVQLKTSNPCVKSLKGIKVQAKASCGKVSSKGEVLFTDYGLSGPPVFWLSAYVKAADTVKLDLMPEYSIEDVKRILIERKMNLYYRTLENYLSGMFQKKIGLTILKEAGMKPLSRKTSEMSKSEIEKIACIIKAWEFPITGTMSWNNAQVTRGGVRTNEINPSTMESRLVEGLYFAGEILDIDGDCGGYNLQWAWSSGYAAGISALGIQ